MLIEFASQTRKLVQRLKESKHIHVTHLRNHDDVRLQYTSTRPSSCNSIYMRRLPTNFLHGLFIANTRNTIIYEGI